MRALTLILSTLAFVALLAATLWYEIGAEANDLCALQAQTEMCE